MKKQDELTTKDITILFGGAMLLMLFVLGEIEFLAWLIKQGIIK